jgi:hypothetical protein
MDGNKVAGSMAQRSRREMDMRFSSGGIWRTAGGPL